MTGPREWFQPRVYFQGVRRTLRDPIRGQLVPHTPEEVVRQQILHQLMTVYGYPAASLSSEELIARGSADRRRADIVIRLPARGNVPRVSAWSDVGDAEPAYSERLANARRAITEPEVSFFEIPDELDLDVDGEQVRVRTLGFGWSDGGVLLFAKPLVSVATLPTVLAINVAGWGVHELERRLAERLSIPDVRFGADSGTFGENVLALTCEDFLCMSALRAA